MDDEFLQVSAADDRTRSCVRWQRGPPSKEHAPHVPIPLGRLGRDVVEVNPFAEEMLEEPIK
jgi:hypothetical protein